MEQQKTTFLSSPTQTQYQYADDEIDLRELAAAIWQGKWLIISITFVFAVGSVLFALSQPNIYKADALLAPTESSGGNGLSKMAAQFGGLASLAGVNLGAGQSSQADLAMQVMKSRQFVEAFIKKHQLLVPLMAIKKWDLETNQLVLNDEVYDSQNDTWLREPSGLRGAKPTAQEAYEVFTKNHLVMNSSKDSDLYTLSISHYSPYIAQQWVTWLIEDINQVMRERSIQETQRNLDYLTEQLDKTAIADMQATFYKLIEEQTKSLMLAQVQDEFVFKVVDPAVVPEIKDKPKRALICAGGTLVGGMLAVMLVLVRFSLRKSNDQ